MLTFMSVTLFTALAFAAPDDPPQPANNSRTVNRAFSPGEKLTYSISWSRIVSAGIASMEVKGEETTDGKKAYRVVSTARSTGFVSKLYPVKDMVQTVIDASEMYSLFYDLDQRHGRRKKLRTYKFDQAKNLVYLTINGSDEQHEVPPRVQDPLSSLYYLRTREDISVGSTVTIDIHEKGKNWAVEIHILEKEKVQTPAGTFDTIKMKTYPKFEGVFMHKGEIYIWLTDDVRRLPVMMKSTITIGSIVAILTDFRQGDATP